MIKAKRFHMTLSKRKAFQGFLFTLPCLVGIAAFFFRPMVQSIYTAFCKIQLVNAKYTATFISWQNFNQAINVDPEFRQKLALSIINMAIAVPLILIFSLFIATILNQKFHGRGLARLILFLPVIIYSAAMMTVNSGDLLQYYMGNGTTFKSLYAGTGMFSINLGQFLLKSGIPQNIVNFITNLANQIYAVISNSGIQILIFLAGLQSVSPSLYEASSIEGATAWENFWLVTFPMVSPLILTCFIYTVIDTFTAYNNVVMNTIQNAAFKNQDFGLSSAMAWIYFSIMLAIISFVGFFAMRKVFYYDK